MPNTSPSVHLLNATMAKHPHQKVTAYERAKKLENPDPGERLLKCYDTIRRSAAAHDTGSVLEVVTLLENSLNFEANALLALKLRQLYTHIRKCVEIENFHEACRIADELHSMWQQGLSAVEVDRKVAESSSKSRIHEDEKNDS